MRHSRRSLWLLFCCSAIPLCASQLPSVLSSVNKQHTSQTQFLIFHFELCANVLVSGLCHRYVTRRVTISWIILMIRSLSHKFAFIHRTNSKKESGHLFFSSYAFLVFPFMTNKYLVWFGLTLYKVVASIYSFPHSILVHFHIFNYLSWFGYDQSSNRSMQ